MTRHTHADVRPARDGDGKELWIQEEGDIPFGVEISQAQADQLTERLENGEAGRIRLESVGSRR